MTSLFADVVGSTALGERLDPSEVKALIGECVSRMCETIESYGGCVRSYMGDGIAGFFGIDVAMEDDVERAAEAALQIRKVVASYAEEVQSTWGIADFNVRVGVNTGTVAVGSVGSASNPQRVALGDAVNVAARLQSMARPGAIVVGEEVAAVLAERFIFQPLGRLSVKGKSATVEAYELESRVLVNPLRSGGTLVGREDALSALDSAVRDVAHGRGQACFVIGEAGIGKSRLLHEVRLRTSSDVLWLEGVCDPLDQHLPYEPLVQVFQGWLGIDASSATAIAKRVRLNARGRTLMGAEFDERAPYLARLLGIGLETKADDRLNGLPADVLTKGLTDSYISWMRSLSQSRPLVLAIDNFEAASEPAVEVLQKLLDELPRMPILLVLAMRADVRCHATSVRTRALTDFHERCRDIRLGPLPPEDSRTLILALDSESVLDERLTRLIAERSDGNPLYIEQLLRAMTSDAGLPAPADALPGALVSLLLARIDRLPAEARRLLQCAAVLGRSFTREVLERMASSEDFDRDMTTLLRADVVREKGLSPTAYAFRHGLVREAALSTLPSHRFRTLSRRAAEALVSSTAFDLERDAESLARHHLASGDLRPAVDCLERLGDKYALISRCAEAVTLFGKCISEVLAAKDQEALTRLVKKQSRALSVMGELDRAIAVLDEALLSAEDKVYRREIVLAKAACLAEIGAVEEGQEALRFLLSVDPAAAGDVETTTLAGKLALDRGDLDAAERLLSELGDISTLAGELGFHACSLQAGVLIGRRCFNEAETWILRAELLAEQTQQISLQLTARRRVALICVLKGCAPEAFGVMKSVHAKCEQLGYTSGILESALTLLHIAHQIGAFDEAAKIGADALRLAPTALFEGMLAANLSVVEVIRGRSRSGERLARRALAVDEQLPSWARIAPRVSLAHVALADGAEGECEQRLMDAFEMALTNDWEAERAAVAGAIAYLYLDAGRYEEARPFAVNALESMSSVDVQTRMSIQRVEVLTGATAADRRAAVARLRQVLIEARRTGLKLQEAMTLIDLARIGGADSEHCARDAAGLIQTCGAYFYLRYLPKPARAASGTLH